MSGCRGSDRKEHVCTCQVGWEGSAGNPESFKEPTEDIGTTPRASFLCPWSQGARFLCESSCTGAVSASRESLAICLHRQNLKLCMWVWEKPGTCPTDPRVEISLPSLTLARLL